MLQQELAQGIQQAVLQLGSNQVTSISSLQLGGLGSLRSLFLQNNDITRIDGLAGLFNLQVARGRVEGPIPLGVGGHVAPNYLVKQISSVMLPVALHGLASAANN